MTILAMLITAPLITSATAETWQMKQRDMHNTGRADYTVPENRMNNTFFNFFLWQKPASGPINSTSMAFYDEAGPGSADIVVGTYHWPKGVQGMDRHTGAQFWTGNPDGGETIAGITPGFSNDGTTLYVVNDATSHPLMAFNSSTGPSTFRHNGADVNPNHLSRFSPTIAPDHRIFLHAWNDRPYGGTDTGTAILETWAASTSLSTCYNDPALYVDGSDLIVISPGRSRNITAYDGDTGAEMWSVGINALIEASVTIDPASGNLYVGAGDNDIVVAGLDLDGNPLWSSAALQVFDYDGSNNPQRAQSTGCLSHDGATYYFQTNSAQGDGRLYAINTADGSVKWSYATNSKGWEVHSSSPVVTQNNVIIIGNNEGGIYYAIKDNVTQGVLLDTFAVETGPDSKRDHAYASATISSDGSLYLPLRTFWSIGNGDDPTPTNEIKNLFTSFDITADPQVPDLQHPGGVIALAQNNAVNLSWLEIPDPAEIFDHYAIYRDTAGFTTVNSMSSIGIISNIHTLEYVDGTAVNGTSYHYAVTAVALGGAEIKEVVSVGPRTPWEESDLQVVSISRTPRYPRYAPIYTYYDITEPSGFGPYRMSAATGLGQGQTGETQRWPTIGDPVTYTATVRNRGTLNWDQNLDVRWYVDGSMANQQSYAVSLPPGKTMTFSYILNWDGLSRDIRFTMDVTDNRSLNNTLAINSMSVPYLSYVDLSYMEDFREETLFYPEAVTDDFIDWVNLHMAKFNRMFEDAGSVKRVHYDLLEVLNDNDPDPGIDRQPFAIFPFRFYAGDTTYRHTGYYRPAEDIDYGYLHEMGHQLGLIDLYRLDVPSEKNLISGQSYTGPNGLMRTCSDFISEHSALAMNLWADKAHGYYGQYMYNIPSQIRMKILDRQGQPLKGAMVKVYQYCERPGQGQVITSQIKAQGLTDSSGEFMLPNVPVDPAKVPQIYTNDKLNANPFGYLAVVGTNGVLHFQVEYDQEIDYAWLDITEANIAYFNGQTETAVFQRQLFLGGPLQYCPPEDMCELNAQDWYAWAQGSSPGNTYVEDDPAHKLLGNGAVKFVTDSGFDTLIRYPGTLRSHWDLTQANDLNISFYADNPSPYGFQNGSPWIRLANDASNYLEYQYYRNGNPYNLLNEARDIWQSHTIPLNALTTEENGWRLTIVGSPDLTDIKYVEIHADTWDAGFTLWVDGVDFDPSPPCFCECDLNHDGKCDMQDWLLFGEDWGRTDCNDPGVDCECDLTGDGNCDMQDWLKFGKDWGRTDCP